MVGIIIVAVCGLAVALSLRKAPDSREHAPSEEERLASYGMRWPTQEDWEDQLLLARELRAALQAYRSARSAGRELTQLQESQGWTDRLAA